MAAVDSEMEHNVGEKSPPRVNLPIDSYEKKILKAVKQQRVTVIHGETGCGKSSRVPVMLLRGPPPEPTSQARSVKMFISQPRRIAAQSLADRVRSVEPDLRDTIALRMGHGVREYETPTTRAWFVTTGYLVRLLANHPETFNSHTHLIIDEVHERSVDTDILCLLCKRLLKSHPTIRLVLMSATMAAALYTDYFDCKQPPIHVAARTFPIAEYYVEDLHKKLGLISKDAKAANDVYSYCEKTRCYSVPSNSHIDKLHNLAAQVAQSVGTNGSSVLIFVPGMNDIIAITELIEKLDVPNVMYMCFPIHSDIPFEEQMAAFQAPGPGEVKIVIATNAAESSITLPDVDHVVCMGLCKQIIYNPSSHRQMLSPCWISKASATQRAGRTGRVRNGNVYRLYSRNTYKEYMDEFDSGEMARVPLDSVILALREMLNEEVTPILLQCLEPPDISNIERSFQSLHKSTFISAPDDSGQITTLGSLVISLGIDLTLGSLVGLGIQFGVAPEAIELAAILSFPQSPWSIPNPLYQEPEQYNDLAAKTFVSRAHFDANLYSEPFGTMNLMWDYNAEARKERFCKHYSVNATRLKRLMTTVDSLRGRVALQCGVHKDSLHMKDPPRSMPHSKVTILRVLQVWTFHDSIIQTSNKSKFLISHDNENHLSIELSGPPVEQKQLDTVLHHERHPYVLECRTKIEHTGHYSFSKEDSSGEHGFVKEVEPYFLSYGIENVCDLMWYCSGSAFHVFVSLDLIETSSDVQETMGQIFGDSEGDCLAFTRTKGGNQRGRRGRPCGFWKIRDLVNGGTSDSTQQDVVSIARFSYRLKTKQKKECHKLLKKVALDLSGVGKYFACNISSSTESRRNFSITVGGNGVSNISKVDICDLFSTKEADLVLTINEDKGSQTIKFGVAPNSPMDPVSSTSKGQEAINNMDTSWHRPLLVDAPEGARVLSVLASGRRREHILCFPMSANNEIKDPYHINVELPGKVTKVGSRWQRFGGASSAYVPENCLPAVAVSTRGPKELFVCCGNSLEIVGGSVRVDGLTLLPPGRLFLLLALVSFGVGPFQYANSEDAYYDDYNDPDEDDFMAIDSMINWLRTGDKKGKDIDKNTKMLIAQAVEFNNSCQILGEKLSCFPNKVKELCRLFDGIDGFSVEPWTDLKDDPLVFGKARISGRTQTPNTKKIKQTDKKKVPSSSIPLKANKDTLENLKTLSMNKIGAASRPKKSKKKMAKYECLKCTVRFSKWNACLNHMKSCCPDTLLVDNNQDACVKSLECLIPEQTSPAAKAPSSDGALSGPKRKYGCLKCAASYKKWGACLEHMRQCCPDMLGTAHQSDESICMSHCLIGGPECLVPAQSFNPTHEILAEESPSPMVAAKAPSSDVALSEPKRKYGCLKCAAWYKKWGGCLEHMRKCCPEMLGPSHQADESTCMSHCLIGGPECLVPTRAILADSKPKRTYGCLKCALRYKKWGGCSEHMRQCCPEMLDTTDNSDESNCMIHCLIGGPECLVPAKAIQAKESPKPLPSKAKKFGCLKCSTPFKKWGKCLEHMEQCCPELMPNRKRSYYVNQCLLVGSKPVNTMRTRASSSEVDEEGAVASLSLKLLDLSVSADKRGTENTE